MQSSPVVAIALRGENGIARIRKMVGPTDSTVAEKGTLRGDFGQDKKGFGDVSGRSLSVRRTFFDFE